MDPDQTKMLVIMAETHNIRAKKATRKDFDQTASQKQSDLGLLYLSKLLGQATCSVF